MEKPEGGEEVAPGKIGTFSSLPQRSTTSFQVRTAQLGGGCENALSHPTNNNYCGEEVFDNGQLVGRVGMHGN